MSISHVSKRESGWHRSKRVTTTKFIKNREIVRRRDQGCCIRCLVMDGLTVPGKEVDHFIPEARGGTDELSNLILLCRECHQEKTQRESNGLSGFKERTGLDGWSIAEPDWLEIIASRNRERESNL